jgi:hypothetical protein
MKIIITGGSGMLGRALSADLVKDGHEVVVLSRNPQQVQERLPAGVRAVAWDGHSAAGWGAEANGAGAIVNLAGENLVGSFPFGMRWTPARKQRIRQSRLDAGRAVAEAIQQAQVKPAVLVQSSAAGYYGPRQDASLDESAPAGSDFLAQVCVDWENSTASVDSLLRRVIIRTGVVLSASEGSLPLQALPFKLFAGGPIGSGRQGYPWIHLTDEVRAIRFLIDNPQARGAFNLTGPELVNNAQFGRALGKALGRPYWLPTPGFVFQVAFGEVSTVLLDGQRPAPTRLQALGFRFMYPTALEALKEIYS